MTNVKIFSDFGCPFCYITIGIVNRLRSEGLEFDVEWIPYEIHPDTPIEGESLYTMTDENQARKMLIMLKRIAKPYEEVIYSDTMDTIFNTRRTLLAGEYAKTVGKYEEFALETFQSAFLHNLNIGDKAVINNIAKKVGLDTDEMNKSIDSGKHNKILEIVKDLGDDFNVEEVPTFLIDSSKTITNVRKYDDIKEAILKG